MIPGDVCLKSLQNCSFYGFTTVKGSRPPPGLNKQQEIKGYLQIAMFGEFPSPQKGKEKLHTQGLPYQ